MHSALRRDRTDHVLQPFASWLFALTYDIRSPNEKKRNRLERSPSAEVKLALNAFDFVNWSNWRQLYQFDCRNPTLYQFEHNDLTAATASCQHVVLLGTNQTTF